MKTPDNERERVKLLTRKDLDISYFCGSGAGGQARNKVASGVQMIHKESGAIGRASDSRSQDENKRHAFERLCATPQMKWWLTKKIYELRQRETLEETVARDMSPENLAVEVKDENGNWKEVPADFVFSIAEDYENAK